MKTHKNIKEEIKIADWVTEHNKNLKPLYKDFHREKQNRSISFFHFATFMYSQCKHPKK